MRLRRRLEESNGLPLTPLIDMVFLVVIFFMLNTSLSINPAIKVDLPAAYTSQAVLEEQIIVTMTAEGQIFLGRAPVELERYAGELKKEMVRLQAEEMILQADERLPYRQLIEVMDLSRLSGIQSIALVTSQKSLPR